MKRFGLFLGLVACGLLVYSSVCAEPGRFVKGRYVSSVVDLPLNNFMLGGGTVTAISTSTTPGYETDDGVSCIVYADGEVSPMLQTFTVGGDYLGDGRFQVVCSLSDATTMNGIDFDVLVNRDATTAVTAAVTNQTVVTVDQVSGLPATLILTPATDFSSLRAYDSVTFRLWRDNAALSALADLEIRSVAFLYTPIGD